MIPFANPHAGFTLHRDEILQAVATVLDSGQYILGPTVAAFETLFAAACQVGHGVGVGNGTDAIELALRGLSVGHGQAVFTVSHTAVGTVAAIERTGATPVLVDIDPYTRCMAADSLAAALDYVRHHHPHLKPAAVVPVHIYGHPAELDKIEAAAVGLPIIEDCAQAVGARYRGRPVGGMGCIGTFSFYPTKNLGGLGDGGCVLTNDATLAERLRALRQYGWHERYISAEPGINSRLDPVQAAILSVLLPYVDADVAARRALAARYNTSLHDSGLRLPTVAPWAEHAYHLYVVETPDSPKRSIRDAFVNFMRERGIGVSLHYPEPVHVQPAYALRVPSGQVILAPEGLPVTEALYRTLATLPLYPQLSDADQERICDAVNVWSKEVGRASA